MPDPKKGDLARSRGAIIYRRPHIPGVQWLILLGRSTGLITGGDFIFHDFSAPLERSARTQRLTT